MEGRLESSYPFMGKSPRFTRPYKTVGVLGDFLRPPLKWRAMDGQWGNLPKVPNLREVFALMAG